MLPLVAVEHFDRLPERRSPHFWFVCDQTFAAPIGALGLPMAVFWRTKGLYLDAFDARTCIDTPHPATLRLPRLRWRSHNLAELPSWSQ